MDKVVAGEKPIHKIHEKKIKEKDILKEEIKEVSSSTKEEILEENKKLKEEIEKWKNDYARAYADTENMKKRILSEEEKARKYRIQSFALEILPALDNFERALAQEISEEQQAFYKGVEMTYNELKNALEKEGVKEIDCYLKPYDANYAQAVMSEKVEGQEKGIVIAVLQKGYMLKDRILRAAMVKVSA